MVLDHLDLPALRARFQSAEPFRHVVIDGLLEDGFAREVAAAFPDLPECRELGHEFSRLNEKGKIQITDSRLFPDPVRRLHAVVSSDEWLKKVEYITGIEGLKPDPKLEGGGMHVTGPRGRLDVHVDFNVLEEGRMYRRLNILIYLNEEWPDDWGGHIELWDQEVKHRHESLKPHLNRCLIFETNDISYHGVAPVSCPDGQYRKSYAAYYYTADPPPNWDGTEHSTLFRARPDEPMRRYVYAPLERLQDLTYGGVRRVAGGLKRRVPETVKSRLPESVKSRLHL